MTAVAQLDPKLKIKSPTALSSLMFVKFFLHGVHSF